MSIGLRKRLAPIGRLYAAILIAAMACAGVAYASKHDAEAQTGATAARVISLNVRAKLSVFRNSVSIHEAKGSTTGTLRGSLFLRIKVESAERMSASFSGSSHSGTLSGWGVSKYRVSGSTLYFGGTVSIAHGTGAYAHASGSGIHIEGTMNRLRKTITMTISGRMRV